VSKVTSLHKKVCRLVEATRRSSTLKIVNRSENMIFGGDGYILSQDATAAISLHPWAIAGFCGMLINAAEMLPLGATDGGRLSLSLFGRQGHSVIGGLTWLALLVSSFTLGEQQGELLVTAWVVNNVVQNNQEVPCRDETDKVNLPRSLAAFALWFLAILAIIPMSE
jgi:membrane-associated protease RseP (regulator of RpoE activity)